jgi:hypothetical protein
MLPHPLATGPVTAIIGLSESRPVHSSLPRSRCAAVAGVRCAKQAAVALETGPGTVRVGLHPAANRYCAHVRRGAPSNPGQPRGVHHGMPA